MKVTLLDVWRLATAMTADPTLSASAARVGVALLSFRNTETDKCFPAYASLADAAGSTRRVTAIEAIRELEAAGWITVERGTGRAHAAG